MLRTGTRAHVDESPEEHRLHEAREADPYGSIQAARDAAAAWREIQAETAHIPSEA